MRSRMVDFMALLAVPSLFALVALASTTAQADEAVHLGGPGAVFRDCKTCPDLVIVPPGAFTMGADRREEGRLDHEGPQRTVTFARAFAVSRFEITRAEFARFVAGSGHQASERCWTHEEGVLALRRGRDWQNPGIEQADDHPVVCVNWFDAKAYTDWLSERTGKAYRLLSEAEWEYAARGEREPGTYPQYHFGNAAAELCAYGNGLDASVGDPVAGLAPTSALLPNTCDDGYPETAPVGSFKANAFGLFDVHGNALEWVSDCYHPQAYQRAPRDGRAFEDVSYATETFRCVRVIRGGAWVYEPRYLRSAFRNASNPEGVSNLMGIRVGRALE
ncbi:MAG: formylglycine-generating enzyme family protein [Pseudomonadota bacterium]